MKATIDREATADAQPMAERLAALERMSATQLRRRYAEVFGEESRSGNRQWLFRRIAWRMQFDAEGSFAQRADEQAREIARQYASDADIRYRPPKAPPPVKAAEPVLTMRVIAMLASAHSNHRQRREPFEVDKFHPFRAPRRTEPLKVTITVHRDVFMKAKNP